MERDGWRGVDRDGWIEKGEGFFVYDPNTLL